MCGEKEGCRVQERLREMFRKSNAGGVSVISEEVTGKIGMRSRCANWSE